MHLRGRENPPNRDRGVALGCRHWNYVAEKRQLPAIVCRLPFIFYRLSSIVYCLLSIVNSLSSVVWRWSSICCRLTAEAAEVGAVAGVEEDAGQVQAAAQQVRMTRADALPQAGIFAGYGYTHGLTVNDETFIDKAGFSVGAKVGIPIFHFGEHFYKVKSDKSEYEQAVSERDSNYELMTLEMSKAANELDESEYERALAASNTASAEENVRVSCLHYDAGTETLSDLLEAQTLWQVANRDSVEADINHFLAWLSYLKTTGQICNEFIK